MDHTLIKRSIRRIMSMVVPIALLIVIDQGVWQIPNWLTKREFMQVPSRCSQIKPGMTSADVLRIMHDGARPFDESLAKDEMHFFWDQSRECKVALDGSQKVVKASVYEVRVTAGFNSN